MKFFIDNWMLISVAFASGAMLLWPVVQGAAASGLSAAAAVQLINRERAVVVDVSETEEFAGGHVGGAKNVPVGQMEQRLPEEAERRRWLGKFSKAGGAAVETAGLFSGFANELRAPGNGPFQRRQNLPIRAAVPPLPRGRGCRRRASPRPHSRR